MRCWPRSRRRARRRERPSLICCKTIIGYGAPHRQGTAEAHGEALGPEEVAAARKALGWEYPPFVVPDEIRAAWDHRAKGQAAESSWRQLFARYATNFPELAREFERRMRGDLPANWEQLADQALQAALKQTAAQATRASSQAALNVLGPALPELLGGSADLTTSNSTLFKGARDHHPGAGGGRLPALRGARVRDDRRS